MQSIAQLRQYYGLSQANLAIYLSISVSLLKMVEQGKRELPPGAALKAGGLQSLAFGLQNKKAAQGETTDPLGSTIAILGKKLKNKVANYQQRVQKSEQLLIDMQNRHQQTINSAMLATQLLAQLTPDEEGKKDKLWIELLQLETQEKKERYGQEAQVLLQWKIDCYKYAAKRANEVLLTLKR